MTQLIIVGQAPSRIGDGRPFTGPSGNRLVKLFGLEDYEALASYARLVNIFGDPANRSQAILCGRPRAHAGDDWDRDLAAVEGFGLLLRWMKEPGDKLVLGCGKNVIQALTDRPPAMFKGRRMAPGLDVWHFPHPSGASHFWNDPENVERAGVFLRKLRERYGIEGA